MWEETLTIRVEHFRDESNSGWFVWVLLAEGHCEFEGSIIKWCVFRPARTYTMQSVMITIHNSTLIPNRQTWNDRSSRTIVFTRYTFSSLRYVQNQHYFCVHWLHILYTHTLLTIHFRYITHPKMTAFQTIMLLSVGAPLTPAGGSSCNLQSLETQ